LSRPSPPPDITLRYGPADDHIADLRLPSNPGTSPAPLVLFLHGGFWRAQYDRLHTGSLTSALATAGYLVCTPEFRRTGQPGGGWPGTFDDVARAVDTLPALIATTLGSPPGNLLLSGHSAGGHLALWAAARPRIPATSPWHATTHPWPAVVALAPVSDLVACHTQRLDDGAADDLIGGSPDRYPDRYALADPAALIPLGTPVHIVHGSRDDRVPASMSRDYAARATAAGDKVVLDELPGCGHFELIDPLSSAWPAVLAAFRAVAPTSLG
jgi:acetyl esterase/lipase